MSVRTSSLAARDHGDVVRVSLRKPIKAASARKSRKTLGGGGVAEDMDALHKDSVVCHTPGAIVLGPNQQACTEPTGPAIGTAVLASYPR